MNRLNQVQRHELKMNRQRKEKEKKMVT